MIYARMRPALASSCLVCVAALAGSCGFFKTRNFTPDWATCTGDFTWRRGASITDPRLTEISGIVHSTTHENIGWVHNDSGDTARVFAVDLISGQVAGAYTLSGIDAYDWEDIAIHHDPSGGPSTIYIADTGDNFERREEARIHAFVEPSVLADAQVISQVETMRVRFVQGPTNVECLTTLADGTLVLASKPDRAETSLFSLGAFADGQVVTARAGDPISIRAAARPRSNRVTGCDFHPASGRFVVRTYEHLLLFQPSDPASTSAIAASTPCIYATPEQYQGESVAVDPTAPETLTLLSEGTDQPILSVKLPAVREPDGSGA